MTRKKSKLRNDPVYFMNVPQQHSRLLVAAILVNAAAVFAVLGLMGYAILANSQ